MHELRYYVFESCMRSLIYKQNFTAAQHHSFDSLTRVKSSGFRKPEWKTAFALVSQETLHSKKEKTGLEDSKVDLKKAKHLDLYQRTMNGRLIYYNDVPIWMLFEGHSFACATPRRVFLYYDSRLAGISIFIRRPIIIFALLQLSSHLHEEALCTQTANSQFRLLFSSSFYFRLWCLILSHCIDDILDTIIRRYISLVYM